MALNTWLKSTIMTVMIHLIYTGMGLGGTPAGVITARWYFSSFLIITPIVAFSAARATERTQERDAQRAVVRQKLFGLFCAAGGFWLAMFAYYVKRTHYDLEMGWLGVFLCAVLLMPPTGIYAIGQITRMFGSRESGDRADLVDWLLASLSVVGVLGPFLVQRWM